MNKLRSVFISYGGPDRDFAERLHSDLTNRGSESFIFSKDALPGTKLHRVMREGVNKYDRVILICSRNSLNRPGVLNEIEEVLQREAREGGTSILIPVILDEYLFKGWSTDKQDIAQAVLDRVVADFTGAIEDRSIYDAAFDRLMQALRPVVPNRIAKQSTSELFYDLLQSPFVQYGAAKWEPEVLRLGVTYGLLIESPAGLEYTSHFLGILCRDAAAVSEKADLPEGVKRLFRIDSGVLTHGHNCEVWSLSPSDLQVTVALANLEKLMPGERETKRRATPSDENNHSVVLWVEVGDTKILLGADLEETKNPLSGWSAIVDSLARPKGTAEVFKVPHHGSENGHYARVWSEMLAPDSICVVTPWNRGRKLPKSTDMDRLNRLSDKVYLTAEPITQKRLKHERQVEKMLRDFGVKTFVDVGGIGQIRCKKRMGSKNGWIVEKLTMP